LLNRLKNNKIKLIYQDENFFKNVFLKDLYRLKPESIKELIKESVCFLKNLYFPNSSIDQFLESYDLSQAAIQSGYEKGLEAVEYCGKQKRIKASDIAERSKFNIAMEVDYLQIFFMDEKNTIYKSIDEEIIYQLNCCILTAQIYRYAAEVHIFSSLLPIKDNAPFNIIDIKEHLNNSVMSCLCLICIHNVHSTMPLLSSSGSEINTVADSINYAIEKESKKFVDSGRKGGEKTHSRIQAVKKIAENTWNKYPVVPAKQMAERLLDHEKNNIQGYPPSFSTIEDWLGDVINKPARKGRQPKAVFELVLE